MIKKFFKSPLIQYINEFKKITPRVNKIIQEFSDYKSFLESNLIVDPFEKIAIISHFLEDLDYSVLETRIINKTVPGGRVRRFRKLIAIGDKNGYIGRGVGKSTEVRTAERKAIFSALTSIKYISRGCGSFNCSCGTPHSMNHIAKGKVGSTIVNLIPCGLGKGLVMSPECEEICELAGIEDLIINIKKPSNRYNTAYAVFKSLEYKL